jgi:cell division protein FtsQ
VVAAAVVGGAALIALSAPVILRLVPFFDVRRVELVGVRYLVPTEVMAALELDPSRSLFAPTRGVVARATQIPGVVNARVERRLPGTLRLILEETPPVAFVPSDAGLMAVDGQGRSLPYDPAAVLLDLPIIERADSVLVRVLAMVRMTDSILYRRVDAARRLHGGDVVLEVGSTDVMLRVSATAREILNVSLVERHMTAAKQDVRQLDARFADQVVVRRSRG